MNLDPQPQAAPRDQDPVLGLLIPEHSHDPILVVGIDRLDGGYSAVWEHLDGEPEEQDYPGRRDVIAFVREGAARLDLPLNLRATRILRAALPPGRPIQGPCLITGQEPTPSAMGKLLDLPDDVTAESLMTAGSVRAEDERPPVWQGDAQDLADRWG